MDMNIIDNRIIRDYDLNARVLGITVIFYSLFMRIFTALLITNFVFSKYLQTFCKLLNLLMQS